jgi:hypothetical protein
MKATSIQPAETKNVGKVPATRGGRRAQARMIRSMESLRSPRTGTTPHFKMWMADLKIKSALQRMKLVQLAEATATEPKAAAGYAIVATDGTKRYKSVWDLINADRDDLLAISGIGPARLTAMHTDLVKHDVQPKWAV